MEDADGLTRRGQVIAGGQRVTVEDDGAQLLAAAVLQRMIADARQGDAAAAWAAWAGVGVHLAMGLGLDDVTWFTRLRIAGIEKPEKEPAEPIDLQLVALPFRAVESGAKAYVGEIRKSGRPRKGTGLIELRLIARVPVDDYEGRDILRRLCQLLTMCQGDGRAAVAELVNDGEYLARVLRWANLAE
ncbi:MAG: hypothetical protein WAV79_07065 [Anaerolineae bacterium]